jgi:hypothetical protein
VAEDEPDWFATIQKPFFVLHDQVVGISIIGCYVLFIAKLTDRLFDRFSYL